MTTGHQAANICEKDGAFRLRYYVSEMWDSKPTRALRSDRNDHRYPMVIETTNGNYAAAQALAGYGAMTTPLAGYKQIMTKKGFVDGMKQYEQRMLAGAKG